MDFTIDDKDLERRQIDFDDLQHELEGHDVGKISRFLAEDDDRSPDAKRRKRAKEAQQRRLIELLSDPVYRATYERLGGRLSEAETQADSTIERYEQAIRATHIQVENMEASATRGPDGQLVFRYNDGRMVDAEGRTLAPEIAAGITWRASAPSAEEYFAAKERLAALEDELNQWRGYRTDTLGSIRDRYENEGDPMSLDEMEDALDRIEAARPNTLSLQVVPTDQGSVEPQASASISLPMQLN